MRLAHAIPLLGDQVGIDGSVRAADQRRERTVFAVGINPVEALVLNAADAWAEAQAQHGEGGEVELGVTVGVDVVLFDLDYPAASQAQQGRADSAFNAHRYGRHQSARPRCDQGMG